MDVLTRTKDEMKRRSTSKQNCTYGRLENRNLLAGAVYVDLIDQSLVVVGNNQDNVVSVDLNAQTTSELVQGHDSTEVRFSDSFNNGFDLSQMNDLRIFTGEGNDVVSIYGEGFDAAGDLIVSLGRGDDSVYVDGGTFGDEVRIFAGANHDSVSLADIEVGSNLSVFGFFGQDSVGLNGVNVQGQTRFLGQGGHDTILVTDSVFGLGVYVEMGQGADCYESVNSEYKNLLSLRGRQGWDLVMLDANELSSTPHLLTIERQTSTPNEIGETARAINQIKTDFFEHGFELPSQTGNEVHDGLSDLAADFGMQFISLDLDSESQTVAVEDPTPSVSVLWDSAVQAAVEATKPGPTVASRAYAMLHTAMYDAWSAYDSVAISTTLDDDLQRPSNENSDKNKIEAMSFAAYRVLDDLFSDQTSLFESVMDRLGFDSSNNSTDVTTAAGIGNRMASALLAVRHDDGSNQLGDSATGTAGVPYSDTSGYVATNPVGNPTVMDAWTPEYVPVDSDPGTEDRIQEFLTPHWGNVDAFAFDSYDQFLPATPQTFLLVDGVGVDLEEKTITFTNGTKRDIDKSLIGTIINPEFISQAEEVVELSANLTDKQKLIAEFWEDGGGTSFPPGTFMTFGELVSARDNNSIDDDAKMFFALGNAVFDAGIATWGAKVHYDYVRPVRAIRELGELGLIGEFNSELGGYAIEAWTPDNGTQTILATDFLTYQTPGGDVSPPFAEYTSGHSAFSAAGATILEMFTGSDTFGATITFESGESRFEPGSTPVDSVDLSWDTFSAAADEAGLSRLYGGIHFTEGDVNGRTLGKQVGNAVWNQTQFFINGGV